MLKRFMWTMLAALILTGVPAVGQPEQAEATTSVRHGAAVLATQYHGRPYRMGANGPRAFDCSGLVRFAYRRHGLSLPRTANAMYHSRKLRNIARGKARRDDVVFWVSGGNAYHVGLYLGGNRIIHTGDSRGVRVVKIWGHPTFKRPRALR